MHLCQHLVHLQLKTLKTTEELPDAAPLRSYGGVHLVMKSLHFVVCAAVAIEGALWYVPDVDRP